jgi:predicted nucleotidyltransferase
MISAVGRRARKPREASGRFVLRLAPSLHAMLRAAARDAGLSLNEYCARKLAGRGGAAEIDEHALRAVQRAATQLGSDLLAVVAIGSWARGEPSDGSDVDLLVVVAPRLELTRDLYRAWDEDPLRWGERPVDVHFVHPPGEDLPGGLWAEAAVDGVVLFERGFALSARLARVRRAIAEGRLVRRFAHGQPYWAEVA